MARGQRRMFLLAYPYHFILFVNSRLLFFETQFDPQTAPSGQMTVCCIFDQQITDSALPPGPWKSSGC